MPNMIETDIEYQPTIAQKERAASLQRFNWLFVYLPFALFALIWLVIIGLLLYTNLAFPNESLTTFTAAVANTVVILGIAPLLILCPILPLAILGLVIHGRREGYAPLRRLQTLFWKTDNALARIQVKVENATHTAAKPLIQGHARAAYVRTLLTNLKGLFKRS